MNDTSVITIEPETKASTSTALTVLKTSIPALIAADKDDLLSKLKAEIDGFEPDTSTKKGRELIASMAMKPRRVKAAYGRIADSLKEGAQATIKTVNAENKQMAELLDGLAVDLRRPLDEIEAFEAAREKANKDNIAAIEALADGLSTPTADEIKVRYRSLSALVEFSWSIEFTARAQRVRDGVVAQLEIAHQAAKQREESAAAEVVRLAEEAERQRLAAIHAQRLREEQIARDAAEAARVAAEARAAREAEEAATRAREAQEAAAQRERDAAQALAQAERDKQEAEQRAQRLANEAEAARVDGHQEALAVMRKLATLMIATDPVPAIDAKIGQLAEEFDRDWEEFADEAAEVHQECLDSLQAKRAHSVHAAEISAQQDRDRAAAQAKRDADAAVEAERRRMEQVRAAEEAERARQAEAERVAAEKRAANRAHQAKINGEVLVDIVAALAHSEIDYDDGPDIATQIAKAIITAAAKNEIRHFVINY